MTKHPGPWTVRCGYVKDGNGIVLCQILADDPETRAVLLHAAEMFKTLQSLYKCARSDEIDNYEGTGGRMLRDEPRPLVNARRLLAKIESEIAKPGRS